MVNVYPNGDYQYLGQAFSNAIREHCPFYHHILDVGCGQGVATDYMRPLCDKMMLIDPSPSACVYQTRHWAEDDNVAVRCCDIHSLTGQFDLIYYFLSLHHISDTMAELSKVRELLNPNGELVICEVASNYPTPFHGSERVPHDGFTLKYLSGMLQSSDFNILKQKSIGTIIKNQLEYDIFIVINTLH